MSVSQFIHSSFGPSDISDFCISSIITGPTILETSQGNIRHRSAQSLRPGFVNSGHVTENWGQSTHWHFLISFITGPTTSTVIMMTQDIVSHNHSVGNFRFPACDLEMVSDLPWHFASVLCFSSNSLNCDLLGCLVTEWSRPWRLKLKVVSWYPAVAYSRIFPFH